jgi:hypothetical protein
MAGVNALQSANKSADKNWQLKATYVEVSEAWYQK